MKESFLAITGLILFVLSCARGEAPTATAPVKTGIAEPEKAKVAWQVEWDNLLKEARREGKVMIYTSAGGQTPATIAKGFKESLGMNAEMVSGAGPRIIPKLLSEKKAGLNTVDIYIGGFTPPILDLKPQGMLEYLLPVLVLPEVKEGKYWYGGELRWVDKDKTVLSGWAYPSGELLVNKDLVTTSELSSLKDLLNPKWKGKIVMYDASIAGAAASWFFATSENLGIDFMKKLALQEPAILRDHRLIAEWIARGKFAVGISVASEMAEEFIKAGAPLRMFYPPENAYIAGGSGAISLIKNAPHPAAARVFVNWYLSREGQMISSRAQGVQSAREDLPTDHLNPEKIRRPSVKYIDLITEEGAYLQADKMKLAREIFVDLMR